MSLHCPLWDQDTDSLSCWECLLLIEHIWVFPWELPLDKGSWITYGSISPLWQPLSNDSWFQCRNYWPSCLSFQQLWRAIPGPRLFMRSDSCFFCNCNTVQLLLLYLSFLESLIIFLVSSPVSVSVLQKDNKLKLDVQVWTGENCFQKQWPEKGRVTGQPSDWTVCRTSVKLARKWNGIR